MSIKLLQITAAYKPAYIYGGPTMSVSKLCEALSTIAEVEIEVLTTTANGETELNVKPSEKMDVDGVNTTYFRRLTKDHTHFSPALLFALCRKIKEQNNLIIHMHAWWNLVSILSCLLAKWYNIPVVLSPRGMLTNYTAKNRNTGFKSAIHALIGKRLLKYCHIHATSEKEKQDVLSIIQPKSITIIPNLVNLPDFRETPTKDQDAWADSIAAKFSLLFLSRVEEKKGLELLFNSLVDLPFDWQLMIAGSGEAEYVMKLKALAESLNINTQINWLGHVNNEHKFKLIAQHDLLVLTSYNENFANVVIESLSVGTPVLLSDQVGLADYVKEKELGWVTNLTVENIRENIIASYNNQNKRELIRRTAPEHIENDFEPTTLINKYISLYKKVNNGRL